MSFDNKDKQKEESENLPSKSLMKRELFCLLAYRKELSASSGKQIKFRER